VIGDEAREQAQAAEGTLPARVIACVGGGSLGYVARGSNTASWKLEAIWPR
jgi:tryptophan synthase beta subunit